MSLSSLAFGSEHNEICGGGRAFLELSSVRWCVSLPFFGILISVAGPHGGKRVHCSCLTAGRSTIFCFEPFMYSRSVGGFFFEYSWFPSRHAGLGECFTWNWAELWMWVWMGCLSLHIALWWTSEPCPTITCWDCLPDNKNKRFRSFWNPSPTIQLLRL